MGLAGSECHYMVSLVYKVHAVNALLLLTAAMFVILSSLFSFKKHVIQVQMSVSCMLAIGIHV